MPLLKFKGYTDASMLIQVFFFHHIFKPWETVNLYSQFSLLCPNHFTYFRPSININTLLSSLDTFSLISYGEFIFFPVRFWRRELRHYPLADEKEVDVLHRFTTKTQLWVLSCKSRVFIYFDLHVRRTCFHDNRRSVIESVKCECEKLIMYVHKAGIRMSLFAQFCIVHFCLEQLCICGVRPDQLWR